MIIHENFPLSEVLWYKVGGVAKFVLDIEKKEDVEEALQFIKQNNIKNTFVCGQGTNLIFTDSAFDGVVLRFVKETENGITLIDEATVEVFAGKLLDTVILFGFDHGLVGLEWAGGLPGTVGGAVRGNSGAFGGEMKDLVESVTILDLSKDTPTLQTVTNEEMQFVYRGSIVRQSKDLVITSAKLRFKKATEEELNQAKEVYKKNIAYRQEKHPMEYPTCGSVFKNIRKPEEVKKVLEVYPDIKHLVENKWYGKVSMGYLIALLGFKGFTIGGAQVSLKHQNYIVNLGNAKSSDIVSIIEAIRQKFQEVFGFSPDVEAEIVR